MKQTFYRLLRVLRPHKWAYIFGILGVTVTLTLRQVLLAWILKDLFDMAVNKELDRLLITVIVGLLVVTILGGLRPIFKYYADRAVYRSIGLLRKELFQKVQRLPIDFFFREHSGNTISRMTNDIKEMETVLAGQFVTLASNIICVIAVIIAMFFLDFWLAILAIVTAGIALICNFVMTGSLRDVGREVQDRLGGLTESFSDLLAGMKVTKAFNLYDNMGNKFGRQAKHVYQVSTLRVRLGATLDSLNDFGKMIDIIGVMGVGSLLAIQGKVSVGAVIGMWQLKTPILTFFNYLGQAITDIQTALAASERVFAILDEPAEPAMYLHLEPTLPQESDAAIVMRNVDFGYRADDQVLQSISLTIPKGVKAAIVGPSGQGKSTIIKLLMGFYPPKRGTLLIEGRSIRETELVELRTKIAYVPQNAYLFSGTIMENIRYGRMSATDEEVIGAAKLANAHEFIVDFDDGYQTYVGERGAQISGGQRQRIGIARAILKNTPILLLDEATSALDTESELLVQEALHRLSGERTIVFITHRFSAIKNVDMIFVIAGGRVTEQGTHDELIKHSNGTYRLLYEQHYQNLQDIS